VLSLPSTTSGRLYQTRTRPPGNHTMAAPVDTYQPYIELIEVIIIHAIDGAAGLPCAREGRR
jgi:hypothetical protein